MSEIKEREAAASFVADFKNTVASVRSRLSSLSSSSPSLESEFLKIETEISALRERFNQATVFLSSYDTQKSMEELKSLQDSSIQLKSDLNPQKKFSFKSKKKTPEGTPTPSPPLPSSSSIPQTPSTSSSSAVDFSSTGTQFKDLSHTVLKHPGRNEDVAFTNIEDSKLYLTEPTTAVRINKARRCVFVVAPVAGSVFIEDCHDCVFVLACHQLRIHDTTGSKLFIRVTSRPIIEDCKGLGFAPDGRPETGEMLQQLQDAKLDPKVNFWDQVEDFKWLRQTKSPNWEIILEDQRDSPWDS